MLKKSFTNNYIRSNMLYIIKVLIRNKKGVKKYLLQGNVFYFTCKIYMYVLFWGLGIGDWGLAQSPIPNPQSPIPNPQSPIPNPQSPK